MDQVARSQAAAVEDGSSAYNLVWEIMRFLWSCPNKVGDNFRYRMAYAGDVQKNIIDALATGQFILFRFPNGQIEHFLAYWRITEEEIAELEQGIEPADKLHGDKIFIVEHGNKGGRESLTRMIKEIKIAATGNKGVAWRNFNRGTFKVFLNKRGA